MFCCHCGGHLEQNFVFCPSCGKKKSASAGSGEARSSQGQAEETPSTSSTSSSRSQGRSCQAEEAPSTSSTSSSRSQGRSSQAEAQSISSRTQGRSSQASRNPKSKATVPNFSSFKKEKEVERRSHFEPKSKKKKTNEKNEEVLINVGLMEFDSGYVKKVFGKTFPVKLYKEMNYDEVLEKSQKKWEDYDRTFSRERGYVLAYPDGKLARFIPGTEEEFVLSKYKEGLGKPYSRITLFLAPVAPKSKDMSTDFLVDQEQDNLIDEEWPENEGSEDMELEMMEIAGGDFDRTNFHRSDMDHGNLIPYEVTDFV